MSGYPLDLETVSYSYLERPNRSILRLLARHAPDAKTILDIGCGCGANGRAIREVHPEVRIIGIEPDPRAGELARAVCDHVYTGTVEAWLASGQSVPQVDVVLLSDVLEHIADPVGWLRGLASRDALAQATWIVSIPNYGVWYNRVRTLFGRFDYQWSGLYDRTHLRFYTRKSIRRLLAYCGFDVIADRGTASLVQSVAPLLRRKFQRDLVKGDHLALLDTPAYRAYRRFVEPAEEAFCNLRKELLAFQIVTVARRKAS